MSSFKSNEQARLNRLASMTDTRAEQGAPAASPRANQFQGRTQLREACLIRLDRIIPDPNQPRVEFDPDALSRLAESLKARGQLQPIRVRWSDEVDRYVVVVGERRWRAAQLAGLESLTCVVVAGAPTPEDLLEDQLIENCLREDLTPIDQARAFRSLLTARNLTQRQLAERLQIGQASIAKALALLDLPEAIQASVDAGAIGPDTAYQLTRVEDPAEQAELARATAEGRLKRDELQERARTSRKGRGARPGRKMTSRVFRTAAGRATVELRKGSGRQAIRDVLHEALRMIEAELGEATQEAA